MAVQDQSGVARLQGGLTVGNEVSFVSRAYSVPHVQLNDQFSCGNDYSPKVRKPYTITKQRERWTDDEHKKFLEALKLYGRAWRRIEEHVGTKTAVQIRSHAQKFFSKVVRDSSGNPTSLVEPIEIPPPRPKRKPMHPYPRKLVEIPKREISNLEHSVRSNSPKSADVDQENKSPKSVLSAIVSDTLGSSDSDTLAGSLSPVSSMSGGNTSNSALAEPKSSFEEDRSTPLVGLNANSAQHEHPLVKLELSHNESVSTKDDVAEESSSRTLKLFGTTLLLTDTCTPINEVSKPVPINTMHLMQLQSRNSDATKDPATVVAPWWILSHNRPFIPLHKQPEEKNRDSDLGEFETKEVQKEPSWSGSNTSSVSDEENTAKSKEQGMSRIRVRPRTFGKGFVPYKRCMAEREKNHYYSTMTCEKTEEQRIKLSL
ncbi:hypothetical protein HN51_024556 [Arachis hypogaea]|uniref:Protein REVEILLE 1 n=1 Tax=Arachis duranensis TaxID=130453 RepID=A0A6P4BWQ7_ARADU|nr:protein REVEILLE 1 [Arachis duranensis]XP_015947535.1 protein REVEILLE 1-like [Arachis duranensis]XP_025609480.1 protein REVEILLE 1 [Arachis hypogaea]QHO27603.1 Protein REVEILLE [Arachis hypogaea]